MKLTERRLRKFFPYDNRLIHFVAKRYGYNFKDNDVVDSARYYSFVNVTRYLKKHGDEFESEGEMVGMIMSSIRYGILSSYPHHKDKKRVETINESSLFYNSSDDDYSHKYEKALIYTDPEIGGYETFYEEGIANLTEVEKVVLDGIVEGYEWNEISQRSGISYRQVKNAKGRIQTKFKNLIKEEDEASKSTQVRECNEAKIRRAESEILLRKWRRSKREEQEKERSRIKTISFLYSKN